LKIERDGPGDLTMLLQDKNAVIYGGGGAIGGAVARVFAREGAKVFIAGRTQAKLDKVARAIAAAGGTAETAQIDALDEQAVQNHANDVAAKAGSIDIALNAVSIMHVQGVMLTDLALETFMQPIDGFLRTLFITSKAVAPHMGKKRPAVILTLSTPGSKLTVPGVLGYGVTCAAKEAFSRILAAELAPSNVRVVCIRPHAIPEASASGSYSQDVFEPMATAADLTVAEMLADAAQETMLKRLPTLAEVAETAAFLASDRASAMTGTVANLTCGLLAD
jgi:NAD(P)-dependent dehydrogenase (short-subunit alcohol dehydrogenase family)